MTIKTIIATSCCLLASVIGAMAGSNFVVGSLSTPRYLHTATLLPNGKVLVAGGLGSDKKPVGSAELFDPATGAWSSAGSMGTPRWDHTATLLPNGTVLISGGRDVSDYLSSAELYDPNANSWSSTGSLTNKHVLHTATLLNNGKVLVAGGAYGTVQNSAELYDPASRSWSPTGSLNTGRGSHTATLLPNGQVLVVGGVLGGGFSPSTVSTAELYDPGSGVWSNAKNAPFTARFAHTATLLTDGSVLVAGGQDTSGHYFNESEIYHPTSQLFTHTNGAMAYAHASHSAVLLPNGNVLISVGYKDSSGDQVDDEQYDPATGQWVAGPLVDSQASNATALLPNGEVLYTGGYYPGDSNVAAGPYAKCYIYSPGGFGAWSNTGNLPLPLDAHTANLLPSGKVLVAGGYSNSSVSGAAQLYDSASGKWSATGNLNDPRGGHSATLLGNGKVLVAGGDGLGNSTLSSAELYEPASGTWNKTGSLSTPRTGHTATLLPDGKVLVTGGYNESSNGVQSCEVYDSTSGTWTATGNLNASRYHHTATLMANGKVLVTGGGDPNGNNLQSAEIYDPAAGTWTNTNPMSLGRNGHTATLLPSGQILVQGGNPKSGATELFNPGSQVWTLTKTSCPNITSFNTATLFPSGLVLITGGINDATGQASNYCELYNPAAGYWLNMASLNNARSFHTATLLASGKLLIAGGENSGSLATAEIFDPLLGYQTGWQPQLNSVSPSPLQSGSALIASGTQFTGLSEASGGNAAQNSSANYPVVELLSLTNEQSVCLSLDETVGWSTHSFTSTPITLMADSSAGFPAGFALATVFTNGIPSQSQIVQVGQPPPAVTPTPGPTASPNPSSTPTPTPAQVSAQPLNISTRMEVLTGDNVLIAGFIIAGTPNTTKQVMIRGLGPSLASAGVANPLADPLLELHDSAGATVATNDNWQDDANSGNIPSGFQPSDPREAVIVTQLKIGDNGLGSYTAIVRGADGGSGVGLIEAYDLSAGVDQFANISTRGFIDTGANVMIGGFILGGGTQSSKIIVRGLGPSLGVSGELADPTLELHDNNGNVIAANDDWQNDANAAQVQAAGIAPTVAQESALYRVLAPGSYTVIVSGVNGSTGIGLVEVYNLNR